MKYLLLLLIATMTGCVVPGEAPTTSSASSNICTMDDDGVWHGCGPSQGGGGGGGIPINTCPQLGNCDPREWVSDLTCIASCYADPTARCQALYECAPGSDDVNCHAGYCENWH